MKCVNGLGTFYLLWKPIPYQASRVSHTTFKVFSPRLVGKKQPANDDLRFILVLTLFLRVKFSEIYAVGCMIYKNVLCDLEIRIF